MYSRKNNNLKYKKSSLWQKRKVIKILTRFGHFKNWDFPIFIEIVIEEASGRSEYCIRINLLNSKRVLSNWLCWPRSKEPHLNHLKIKFQKQVLGWRGDGMNWETGTDIYTSLCVKQITNCENLLYSTGNYTQCSVVT